MLFLRLSPQLTQINSIGIESGSEDLKHAEQDAAGIQGLKDTTDSRETHFFGQSCYGKLVQAQLIDIRRANVSHISLAELGILTAGKVGHNLVKPLVERTRILQALDWELPLLELPVSLLILR